MSYTLELILEQITDTSLNLRNEPFTIQDIPTLITALKSPACVKLTDLDLSRAEIDDDVLIALSHALTTTVNECGGNFSTLTSLTLSHNPISQQGAAGLANFLQTQQLKICELDLSSTKIGDNGAILFKDVKYLRMLRLAENNLTVASFRELAKNESLEELDLGQNQGGDDGAAAFRLTKIPMLYLENNGITAFGVSPLALNTSLRSLWLSDNPICGDASLDGAELLAASPLLEVLVLNNCNVGLRGAKALGASKNENLSVLMLQGNKFGDAAIPFLAAKKSILKLGLAENNLTDTHMKDLAENNRLVSLFLMRNKITDTGAKLFVDLNGCLTTLGRHDNMISAAMDSAITVKLQLNANLAIRYQADVNVFIYEYHVARKLLQTTNKALASAPADIRPYLLLLPLDIVSHILTFLPYSYVHKTREQIKTHFNLFNAFMSEKGDSLVPRLKEKRQQETVLIRLLFLDYQRERQQKRVTEKQVALTASHTISPIT